MDQEWGELFTSNTRPEMVQIGPAQEQNTPVLHKLSAQNHVVFNGPTLLESTSKNPWKCY